MKQKLSPEVKLSENFFIKQKGILNVSLSDENFAQNLLNSLELIDRFFSSETGSLEPGSIEQVSEAFLSGTSESEEETPADNSE